MFTTDYSEIIPIVFCINSMLPGAHWSLDKPYVKSSMKIIFDRENTLIDNVYKQIDVTLKN